MTADAGTDTSKRPRRSRLWIALVALAAVGALAVVVLNRNAPASARAPAAVATQGAPVRDAALAVTVFDLEPVDLARNLSLNGAIHAWQEVIIAPEVGGFRVAEVHVEVGDTVSSGQTLVTLSTALLNAELATRQAMLKQREAELMNAEAALTRGNSLSAMDVLAQADLDRLRSDALAAEARLESARADLETAQLRLEFARVAAPDDGVITSRTVTVGQIAQAGAEMLRLLRQGRVEWRGEVPEALLADLTADQAVTVTTADGTKLSGRVRVVAPTIANANRTGLVYVDLDANPNVRPGMFARGAVELGRSRALMVPLESVVSADGYSYVFVLGGDDDTVTRRRIETGTVLETDIEVVSGLRAGEVVVEQGAGFLKDGDRVNVVRGSGS